jgi:hypothetical protein
MKQALTGSFMLFAFCMSILIGCKKDDTTNNTTTTVCDVKGTYSGTSLSSLGVTSTQTYRLQDNNFAVGSVTPAGASVTFGGYKNTCDSVYLSVYYTSNSSYYLLQGILSNNKNTISGSYANLTTPADHGTFTITK